MEINFSIKETVNKRSSVRTYKDQILSQEIKEDIQNFISSLENPFGKTVNYHFLDHEKMKTQARLGTYGMIKGAEQYIGTSINLEPLALEALGYEFEVLILYLTSKNIGTCWLGGTFDRQAFAQAMGFGENELLPIITPYGYSADKKSIKEASVRKLIKADRRKSWSRLFFENDFNNPLSKDQAGDLAFPLEMVRLGPSASNKQPWRLVIKDKACHFFEYKTPGYSDKFPYDIQRIDLGIAACHFDLAVKEKGMSGFFDYQSQPDIALPENMEYAFSWIRE